MLYGREVSETGFLLLEPVSESSSWFLSFRYSMISRKHAWILGKARSCWDLASLALLAVLIATVLAPAGRPLLAFFSSPVSSGAGRPPVEVELPTQNPTATAALPSVETSRPGGGWQRPVGVAAIALGIVLILGGVAYLVRFVE